MSNKLIIADREFKSRLFLGTGKYSSGEELSKAIFDYSGFGYDDVYGGYGNTEEPEAGPFGP